MHLTPSHWQLSHMPQLRRIQTKAVVKERVVNVNDLGHSAIGAGFGSSCAIGVIVNINSVN